MHVKVVLLIALLDIKLFSHVEIVWVVHLNGGRRGGVVSCCMLHMKSFLYLGEDMSRHTRIAKEMG